MTTLTKLLPEDAHPAQAVLEKGHPLELTSAQRAEWTNAFETPAGKIDVAVEEPRPLNVADVFVDENGEFWVVVPAIEKVVHVSGDLDTMREAATALINRGVPVAEAPDGFAVLPMPNVLKMFEMIGLETVEVDERFNPIRFDRHSGGCGCGGGSCGCGGHGHEEGGCGCGGHGHDHDHHHEGHGEGGCCCGNH